MASMESTGSEFPSLVVTSTKTKEVGSLQEENEEEEEEKEEKET